MYRIVNTRQRSNESRHTCMERLLTSMQRFEQADGDIAGMINIKKIDKEVIDTKHKRQLVQRLGAMMAFHESGKGRYGSIKTEYFNDKLDGVNKYPKLGTPQRTSLMM